MYKYDIDYAKQRVLLLPTFLRQNKIKAYLGVLIMPVKILYAEFVKFKNETIYKITHNGQVVYLQKVLNDRFDRVQRRIYITNGFEFNPTFIYTHEEDKPVYLGKKYLYTREELMFRDVDFLIYIPIDLELSEEELIRFNALVKYYKLVSKTYRIIKR